MEQVSVNPFAKNISVFCYEIKIDHRLSVTFCYKLSKNDRAVFNFSPCKKIYTFKRIEILFLCRIQTFENDLKNLSAVLADDISGY